jgi:hypothetical protein
MDNQKNKEETKNNGPPLGSYKLTTKHLKTSFRAVSQLENFYTGSNGLGAAYCGRLQISNDESFLVSPCGEDIKLFNIHDGKVTQTLKGVQRVQLKPHGASRTLNLLRHSL